jgi:transcription initiation factor IIE alpha subunit
VTKKQSAVKFQKAVSANLVLPSPQRKRLLALKTVKNIFSCIYQPQLKKVAAFLLYKTFFLDNEFSKQIGFLFSEKKRMLIYFYD